LNKHICTGKSLGGKEDLGYLKEGQETGGPGSTGL